LVSRLLDVLVDYRQRRKFVAGYIPACGISTHLRRHDVGGAQSLNGFCVAAFTDRRKKIISASVAAQGVARVSSVAAQPLCCRILERRKR
jgi:hypothetical protein